MNKPSQTTSPNASPKTTMQALQACPVARTAKIIGDEWIMLILRELFKQPQKFDELQKATGIATNILTSRLKRMMDAVIVEKIPYQERPPRFTYKLTKAGLGLLPLTLEMMRYGEQWLPCDQPSTLRLRHTECGKITAAGQVCSECGEPLHLKNLRLESA